MFEQISSFTRNRLFGLIVALATILGGVLYFLYVAPVHSEFAQRYPFGGAYYYFYLGFVAVFLIAGVGVGVWQFFYGLNSAEPRESRLEPEAP